jgi:hypothetical protein
MAKNLKLPQPAETSIETVLEEFLAEQRRRLKPKTLSNYEAVISLFQDCMDGYGHQGLDRAERALFERLYNARGDQHREFCQVFGPEKIPENVGEFVGWFMVRKVMCGKDLLQAAGTVTRKLGKWLVEKGYLEAEDGAEMSERGGQAARNLPAAADLVQMLDEGIEYVPEDSDSEPLEDHFTVDAVKPGKLHLSPMLTDQKVVLSVPRQISDACQVGWTISGALAKVGRHWRLLEVWNVYL